MARAGASTTGWALEFRRGLDGGRGPARGFLDRHRSGAIQDGARDFRGQLFGVSGVFRRSLGAATFVTLAGQLSRSDGIPAAAETRRAGDPSSVPDRPCSPRTSRAPGRGAALPRPDAAVRPFGFPDRAKALEQGWRRAWAEAGFGEDLWRDAVSLALGRKQFSPRALPERHLMLETGKRVITSNVDVAASPTVFRDVYDFYRLVPAGSEIRPSTAAHNSARFTYVSPAGTLADGTHLVDGGYFENFGAVTGSEVLKAGIRRWGRAIHPVAILISNDPNLQEGISARLSFARRNPRPGPGRRSVRCGRCSRRATRAACWPPRSCGRSSRKTGENTSCSGCAKNQGIRSRRSAGSCRATPRT